MRTILLNGSLEPLWRHNARADADKFKLDLLRSTLSRRRFLAGAGVALLTEYVDTRRAVAFWHGVGVTEITNARTGTKYQYLPNALAAMQNGDTILMPAGLTYQYEGTTYYYANDLNTDCNGFSGVSGSGYGSMYLGNNGVTPYGGFLPSCDYGSIAAVGKANNGRALLTPPYGILAQDFLTTDTEMYFEASTPVANFAALPFSWQNLYVLSSYNAGQFANTQMAFSGVDATNNGLTGITGTRAATIPAGTIIAQALFNQNKAIFVAAGANPGWTFSNLELAYASGAGYSTVVSSIQQTSCNPGGPYAGSMTLNNCYIHDCRQGPGIGYGGYGDIGNFAYLFGCELTQIGAFNQTTSNTHNIYIGNYWRIADG